MRFLIVLTALLVLCTSPKAEVHLKEFNANCGSGENYYKIVDENGAKVVEFGVNVPNPCYEARAKLEGNKVVIELTRSGDFCTMCLAYGSGKVSVKGLEDFQVEVVVDGSVVKLKRR